MEGNQDGESIQPIEMIEEDMNIDETNALDHKNDEQTCMDVTKKVVKQDESHLIQIKASNAEILRRITAFIEKKQTEVDDINRQEFCNVHPSVEDDEDSCARCRAIFVPRGDGKSHIKVSRVVNMYGPQTQFLASNRNNSPQKGLNVKKESNSTDGVEERLANMEAHLNLRAIPKVDVYKRLKSLEERILFLESLSPEYFSTGILVSKRQRKNSKSSSSYQDENKELSLAEIDSRIASLKESLMKKSLSTAY